MISVVIPLYNRLSVFKKTLMSLCDQTLPPEVVKIIVVDDCSTDMPEDYVRSQMKKYRNIIYIRHEKNMGLAESRNTGIREVESGVVLFLDADIVANPQLLRIHCDMHSRCLGENVAVVSNIRYPEEFVQGSNFSKYVQSRELGCRPARERKSINYSNLQPRFFAGGATSVSMDAISKAGLFNSAYKLYGGEDIEYGVRLVNVGVRIIYCDEALVYHHDNISLDRYKKKVIECGCGQYKTFIENKLAQIDGSSIMLLSAVDLKNDSISTIGKKIMLRCFVNSVMVALLESFVRRIDKFPKLYSHVLCSAVCGGWMFLALRGKRDPGERVW